METFLIFLTVTVLYVAYWLLSTMKKPKNYPPGPDFAPLVGNAIQMRKEAGAVGGQHKLFEVWAKRYNTSVLGLKLGRQRIVVVLCPDLVKEVHLLEVFEGRPDNFFLRMRTQGLRQGIVCTDGKLWYEHRHFTMKQMRLLGFGRSQMGQHIENEVASFLEIVEEFKGEPLNPGLMLANCVLSILWSMVAGNRFERGDERIDKLLNLFKRRSKVFDLAGGALSHFPWLRFVAPEWTGYNLILELNKELFAFIRETIDEHKATLCKENEDSDFIYAYLREMQQSHSENTTFGESQLVMTVLDFFIAGSHITSSMMDAILMNLAMRQDMQKKVYSEVLANSKNGEFPHLSVRQYYPYTEAFIMEVQRLFCTFPMSGPRRALWDTTLGGYNIPKDTTVLIGVGSVLTNEEHWEDAHEFRPERFFDDEGKIRKDDFFIPFGYGRRRCPGDALARGCLFSFIVSVCQNFELLLSDKAEDKPSFNLMAGIVLSPKPYKISFVKRS